MASVVFEYVGEIVFFEVVKKAQLGGDKYPYFTFKSGPQKILKRS